MVHSQPAKGVYDVAGTRALADGPPREVLVDEQGTAVEGPGRRPKVQTERVQVVGLSVFCF